MSRMVATLPVTSHFFDAKNQDFKSQPGCQVFIFFQASEENKNIWFLIINFLSKAFFSNRI